MSLRDCGDGARKINIMMTAKKNLTKEIQNLDILVLPGKVPWKRSKLWPEAWTVDRFLILIPNAESNRSKLVLKKP